MTKPNQLFKSIQLILCIGLLLILWLVHERHEIKRLPQLGIDVVAKSKSLPVRLASVEQNQTSTSASIQEMFLPSTTTATMIRNVTPTQLRHSTTEGRVAKSPSSHVIQPNKTSSTSIRNETPMPTRGFATTLNSTSPTIKKPLSPLNDHARSPTSNSNSTPTVVSSSTAAPAVRSTPVPTTLPITMSKTTTAPAPEILKHMNATEISKYFWRAPLTTFEQISQLFPKPAVDDHNMIAIYSQKAMSKLRHKLATQHVTLLVNAGSSMAGAANVKGEDRAPNVFARKFHNVTIVDRAHGDRNSFHSMQVMHSYFPTHVDVVLWEFAINDIPARGSVDEIRRLEPLNQFLLYLEQLKRVAQERQQEPPLVLLLYLWDTPPFTSPPSGQARIHQTTFDSHHHAGENFDFVVGQVNAANFYQSWQMEDEQVKAVAFGDLHHPNHRGHLILAYLLHELVTNDQRREKPKETNQTRPTTFTWACGKKTPEKQQLDDLLLRSRPVASFTAEVPNNQKLLPGMLTPIADFGNLTLQTRGRVNEYRTDRQQCFELPCCKTANVSFDVSRYQPLKGMHVTFSPGDNSGAAIFVDRDNVTDQLINPKLWGCRFCYWSNQWGTYLVQWVVLPQWRNVSRVLMCNNLPTCGSDPPPETPLAVVSFSVYGVR